MSTWDETNGNTNVPTTFLTASCNDPNVLGQDQNATTRRRRQPGKREKMARERVTIVGQKGALALQQNLQFGAIDAPTFLVLVGAYGYPR